MHTPWNLLFLLFFMAETFVLLCSRHLASRTPLLARLVLLNTIYFTVYLTGMQQYKMGFQMYQLCQSLEIMILSLCHTEFMVNQALCLLVLKE